MKLYRVGSYLSVIALLLILGFAKYALGTGKGGGKPPPPPPASADPVIVFRDEGNIFVADADGGNQMLVYSGNYISNAVSWCSPDGTDIIFQDAIDGEPGVWRLPIIQVDASGVRTVQVGSPQLVARTPNYEPFKVARCSPVPVGPAGAEQVKVVYSAEPFNGAGYHNLYLANSDGSQVNTPGLLLSGSEHPITGSTLHLHSPSWSPTGDRIAFLSTAGRYDVEVITLDWSAEDPAWINRRSLVQYITGQDCFLDPSPSGICGWDFFSPRWSHRSDLIAVDAGPPLGGSREIWFIPVHSPVGAYRVRFDQIVGAFRTSPSWSPNDTQLVYVRSPRIEMTCSGSGNKRKNTAIAISGILNPQGDIEETITGCDEIAMRPVLAGWKWPDWWRGAGQ